MPAARFIRRVGSCSRRDATARAIVAIRSRSASLRLSQRPSFSARIRSTISVGAVAQRGNRRHDRQRRKPAFEPVLLGLEDRLHPPGLGLAAARVALDDLLEVVDVVQRHAGDLTALGLDVARDRDVDQQQRPLLAAGHHLFEPVALDDVVGRVGRGDDDVGLAQLVGKFLEADRGAAEALREPDRAVVVAVGDEDGGDAARDQRPRDQLGGFAGADHEHAALGEVAEGAARQLDRHRGDRDAALADRGLLAGAATGGERAAEEAVEDRPGRSLDQRQLVGALDLALDLGLADDHRVEPGGDPEEVADGLARAQRVEVAEQLGRAQLGLAGEDAEGGRLRFDGVGDDQVELGAVAGRERRRLVDALGRGQLAERPDRATLGQRESLAQVERGGLVGDAEGQQLRHQTSPPLLSLGPAETDMDWPSLPRPGATSLSSIVGTSSASRPVVPGEPCSAKLARSRNSFSMRCSLIAMIAT